VKGSRISAVHATATHKCYSEYVKNRFAKSDTVNVSSTIAVNKTNRSFLTHMWSARWRH